MEAIKIFVSKQMDGYSFSIMPGVRELITSLFPNSHPANGIFVAYEIKSDFEAHVGKLENYIYPALFGIENQKDLHKKINKILFIDTQSGKTLLEVNP